MSTTQRWTLAVVSAATAMLMLDIAVVNTALPRIADDLNTGLGGLQWVVDAYTLPLAATVLTAGALADRLGRRRVFSVGLVVFTLSSLVAASAGSIEVLNGARAVQGVGGAILFAVSIALLANAFPDERERAKALGIYGATIAGSFAIGPFIGGVLTSGLDWEWVFLINMLLMTFAAVDSSWTVTLPGSIVAMIGTGLFNPSVIAVALESVPGDQSGLAAGVNDTFRQAGIAVGVAALGALVPAEAALGGGSPVEYVDGFRNALFAGAGLVAAGAVVTAVLLRTKGGAGGDRWKAGSRRRVED